MSNASRPTSPRYYADCIVNGRLDAGLYREWLAREYGEVLAFGGCGRAMVRGLRHCRRLASLVPGLTAEQVRAEITEAVSHA